jgi:photosystem II stability/assembly factor-like uncharacterized protein
VNAGLPPFETGPSILVYSMVVDAQEPDMVYAAVGNLLGGKVFKTSNGGGNWSDSSSGLPEGTSVSFLQIDPQIPTRLYAATNAGVFKSTDGGTSWAAVNSGLTAVWVSDLAIDPRNASTLYAATSEGLVKTTDGGINWNPVNSGRVFGGRPDSNRSSEHEHSLRARMRRAIDLWGRQKHGWRHKLERELEF